MSDTCLKPPAYAIPLHRLTLSLSDRNAVVEALGTGLLTGDGAANLRLADLARATLDCTSVFPVSSGTQALELMIRALALEPGDEVICPSFTFVSAANAIILAGGSPVFADVDPHTLNLDPDDASQRITVRTRAILTAHYGGIASRVDQLRAMADAHGISLLEDAAHALGGRFGGRPLGTWGRAGAFSFHGTKNLVAGEGGMLVTSDRDLSARVEVIREKGTDRSRFLRGETARYTWQLLGSSCLMSDILAALVASQWRRLDEITTERGRRFDVYQQAFESLATSGAVTRPTVPADCEPAFHIYYLLTETRDIRDRLIVFLRERGIEASSHFVPLHLSPFARSRYNTCRGMFPVTEQIADRLLRLPLYPSLSSPEQQAVIDVVVAFFGMRP